MSVTGQGAGMRSTKPPMVRVWDPLVRIAHWLLVLGFSVAYVTEDDLLTLHSWAGYVVAGVVLFRVLWGVVGPRHARFSDFVCGPSATLGYLRDLMLLRSRRHLGHSPAGGAMVVALLLSLAATAATGMATLAETRNAGPLAPWLGAAATTAQMAAPDAAPAAGRILAERLPSDRYRPVRRRRSAFKEVHEVFANLTLILVILHVGGVALASLAHRENLVRSMITGEKRADPT